MYNKLSGKGDFDACVVIKDFIMIVRTYNVQIVSLSVDRNSRHDRRSIVHSCYET